MRLRVLMCWLMALALWLALPGHAAAQSVIAGVVKDATGAVLPGVTVEASSAALIEKTRTGVTDEQGQYRIVDLRPGTYVVTFTLTGFNNVKREGIELPANFTASLNAELRVGSLEETITVTGQTPLVDVQQTVKREVITRELLDNLPTGRSFQGIGATVPALSMGRFDVAGSNSMQQGVLVVHGGTGTDLAMEVDGINVMGTLDKGWYPLVYHNDGEYQQMVYQTAGGTAETSTGGVRINMIPKEGGNVIHGSGVALYSQSELQANNINGSLIGRGYKTPGNLQKLWDYNPSIGGPIKKDRIWFFESYRNWAYNNYIGNVFYPDGSPGLDDNSVQAISTRFTIRPSATDRLNISWNRYPRIRYHSGIELGNVTPQASGVLDIWQTYIGLVKWNRTVGSHLMLEAGGVDNYYKYDSRYQPSVKRASCVGVAFASCPAGTDLGDISHNDITLGITDVALSNTSWNFLTKYGIQGGASYVTGAHTVKLGLQLQWGAVQINNTKNADLQQIYQNGRPSFVDVANTPAYSDSRMNRDLGIFLQDTWTIRRLTINPGVRFDNLTGSDGAIDMPAGRFVPARHFDAVPNLPNWTDVSPRLGASFDLFGDGKTALKVSFGKYVQQEATGFAATYNPSVLSTDRRTWTDTNGDDIAQESEIGPSNSTTFGIRRNRNPDPDIKRPYQFLYNAGVTHQLVNGLSVSANYYRRDYRRIIWTENLAVPVSGWASEYTPVDIPDPRGNGQNITVYNISRPFFGLVNELDTNSTNNSRTYNGIDLGFNARFPNGATLLGGSSTGKLHAVTCDVADPNQLRGCDAEQPFRSQLKLSFTYPLPWYGIRASAVFQSMPGIQETRTANNDGDILVNYVVSRTQIPTLVQASVNVRLNSPGTDFLDRDNQLDLSVTKKFTIGRFDLSPQLDLFNLFNVAPVTSQVSTYGTSLGRPLTILPGRLLRFGAQVKF